MIDKLVLVPGDTCVNVCDLEMLINGLLEDEKSWDEIVEDAAIDMTMHVVPEAMAKDCLMLVERVARANASDDVGGTYWAHEAEADGG